MNIAKQIFRNTAAGWSEMVALLVSTMVITPLLITRLGKEGYGVWMLVGQVMVSLGILDLGVGTSVERFVAKYNAGKDYTKISRIANSAIFLFSISSLLTIIVVLILWPNFSKFFHLSDKYFSIGRWLILLTGLGVASTFPLKIGHGILGGIHRYHIIYLLRASGALGKLILVVFFFGLLGYNNLFLLAIIAVTAAILPDLLMCGIARKKFRNLSLGFEYISFSSLKEIWSLSLSAFLVTIATLLFNQGQIISVGKIIGTETVTLYTIPVMLLTCGSMVTAYIVAAFKPMASHMQALDKKQGLRELNIQGVKVSFTICLLIAVMMIAFGYPFFRMWLFASTDFSEQDFTLLYHILVIMLIGFAVGAPQNVTAKMFSGIDKQWFAALTALGASIAGLLVGILLTTKTALGLKGMALGWAAVFFIKGVIVFPVSACYYLQINIWSYLRKAYLPPLAAGAALALTACLIRQISDAASVVPLVLSIALCLAVYVAAVCFICFDQKQITQLWMWLHRFIKSDS